MTDQDRQLALSIRNACIAAAREAYEDAGIRGLCPEGRWEAALGAIEAIRLDEFIVEHASEPKDR